MSTWKIGQKCVCVNDSPPRWANDPKYGDWRLHHPDGLLVRGRVYTVRGTSFIGGELCLLVDGNIGRIRADGQEQGWMPERFRPLITKTQEEDIAEMWKLVRDIPAEGKLDLISELLDQ